MARPVSVLTAELHSKRLEFIKSLETMASTVVGTVIKAFAGNRKMAAIKAKCLDCCAYQRGEIVLCTSVTCSLWQYRPYVTHDKESYAEFAEIPHEVRVTNPEAGKHLKEMWAKKRAEAQSSDTGDDYDMSELLQADPDEDDDDDCIFSNGGEDDDDDEDV